MDVSFRNSLMSIISFGMTFILQFLFTMELVFCTNRIVLFLCRLSNVEMDSAEETELGQPLADDDPSKVFSVEQCQCPPGYYGTSCESCDIG